MFHISPRFGNVRPFIGVSRREDGYAGSLEAGFTTYAETEDGNDETYQTTYVGLIGRADHIGDAVQGAMGNDTATRLVSEVTDDIEANHAGSAKQNANHQRTVAQKATEGAAKSLANATTEKADLAVKPLVTASATA